MTRQWWSTVATSRTRPGLSQCPIYQTVAHQFDDAAQAGAVFDLEVPGFHYNRLNNPTNAVLEARLQALEAGAGAVLTSSGAAAVNYSILNLATAGDNIVTTPQLYGSTYTLFAHVLPSQGIEVRFAEDDRPECIEAVIDAKTKAIFCESVGNPALNVVDLESVGELARSHGVPLIVDNTIATPMYLKPIELRRRCGRRVIDQVHRWAWHHPRRRHHRRRHVPVVRCTPTSSRCSTARSPPSTASFMPSSFKQAPLLCAAGP